MAKTIFAIIKKFIVQKFWPWFIQYVWPIIQSEVVSVVMTIFEVLRKRVERYVNNRNQTQQDAAQKKAAEAERQAESATDAAEAAHFRGRAEAYREQAESLSRENAELRRELNKIIRLSANDVQSSVDNIKLTISDSDHLEIGNKNIPFLRPTDTDDKE